MVINGENIYTPTKPPESSFRVEANEDIKSKFSKLKMVVDE